MHQLIQLVPMHISLPLFTGTATPGSVRLYRPIYCRCCHSNPRALPVCAPSTFGLFHVGKKSVFG
jgi:hypothetical protein